MAGCELDGLRWREEWSWQRLRIVHTATQSRSATRRVEWIHAQCLLNTMFNDKYHALPLCPTGFHHIGQQSTPLLNLRNHASTLKLDSQLLSRKMKPMRRLSYAVSGLILVTLSMTKRWWLTGKSQPWRWMIAMTVPPLDRGKYLNYSERSKRRCWLQA